jgi:hypothetical protein
MCSIYIHSCICLNSIGALAHQSLWKDKQFFFIVRLKTKKYFPTYLNCCTNDAPIVFTGSGMALECMNCLCPVEVILAALCNEDIGRPVTQCIKHPQKGCLFYLVQACFSINSVTM